MKDPKPRASTSLRRQLLLWLMPPMIVLWVVSAGLDYDIARRFVTLAYDRALLDSALDIGRQIKELNGRVYVDLPKVAIDMLQTAEHGRIYYRVTGPTGEYVTGEPDLPAPAPGTERVTYEEAEYLGKLIRMVVVRVPVRPGSGQGVVTVQVAEPVDVRTASAQEILLRITLPELGLIYIAALAIWIGVRRGIAPLTRLQHAIENRDVRDLGPLPEANTPAELRPLIHAMNELLQRLGNTLAAQERFIADAAHQLRTPVAGIHTQTELALRASAPVEREQALQQLHTASTHLSHLIHQLLSLARSEPAAQAASAMTGIDLNQEMREATSEWVPQALRGGIDLGYDGPDQPVMVKGNAFLLREMLNNLIDNALRYSPRGSHVTVKVANAGAGALLQVEDDGPGIASSEREQVFERFYRATDAGEEGCGLGLAIVREVARGHDARVTIDAGAEGRGTAVVVSFPAFA